MRIKKIVLKNYRLYFGENCIEFEKPEHMHNVWLIAGQNGFGKTTFLHSLLWCLYGRMISDVDEVVKKEISAQGGYSQLLENNLNNTCLSEVHKIDKKRVSEIKRNGYSSEGGERESSEYYVLIEFEEVNIPSIPCNSLTVIRKYDYILSKESLEIFIDGKLNELSGEIGGDVFINDFVLNKDVARFFFFDSERIVSLAETNTLDYKRKLCSAYNEVLGVKKYEDLKKNLENLRLKFRRQSHDIAEKERLDSLVNKEQQLLEKQRQLELSVQELENNLNRQKELNDNFQVQLLREGSGVSIDELKRLEALKETSKRKDIEYKQMLKKFLDFAPFAIAGNVFDMTVKQVKNDFLITKTMNNIQNQNILVDSIFSDVCTSVNTSNIGNLDREELIKTLEGIFQQYRKVEVEGGDKLVNISSENYNDFIEVYNSLTTTYKVEFERLADDYRKNKQVLERTARRISSANSKENDSAVKAIREKKNQVEKEIISLEHNIRELFEARGECIKELSSIKKQITELSKKICIDDSNVMKDRLAGQLIGELDCFLDSLKREKKISLESRIRKTLNSLMHKSDFVGDVRVDVIDEGIDINLFSPAGSLIKKETLSKGEQQLYATSILKSLVDESGIDFPVFIDSPLQKFDKTHSNKIITEFYPSISKQVVLFPLLHKELTSQELSLMSPIICSSYIIKNDDMKSYFEKVDTDRIMEIY